MSGIASASLMAVARVRQAMLSGLRDHFAEQRVMEVRVPVLVDWTGACENVATVFTLDQAPGLVLTQTGQLALERALEAVEAVWCHTGSFRAEMVDSRHLREFELLEEEVRYTHPLVAQELTAGGDDVRLQMLLARVSRTIKAMISSAITQCEAEIASLGGDVKALAQAVEERFPVITYREALDLLSYESRTQPRRWGSELTRRDEARLLQELSEGSEISRPVFVTYFPEELKFFNMKVDRGDQAVVCSADLLLPTSGEAVGAALREEDHRILTERFDRLMRPQLEASVGSHHTGLVGFDSYLAAVRSGRLQPHGGYGVGLERVLQFVFKAGDIRDVSVPTILAQW